MAPENWIAGMFRGPSAERNGVIVPVARFDALSSLRMGEATDALRASVEPPGFVVKPHAPFMGEVFVNGRFRIWRSISGYNSGNPVLYGALEPSGEGTRIRVLMTLHPAAWVFLVGLTLLLSVAIIDGQIALAAFCIAFLWAITLWLFFRGVFRSKRLLAECLKARPYRRPE